VIGTLVRGRRRLLAALALLAAFACLCVVTSARADGVTLFVVPSGGATTGDCESGSPPCDIDYAVGTVAQAGDTISLAAGTYDDAIDAPIDLSFVGAGTSGPNATTINSTGIGGALTFTAGGSVSDLALENDETDIGEGGA
jgi:hypothetical protein